MTRPKRNQSPSTQAWLEDLARRVAAEDAADAQREQRRIKRGLPEGPRELHVYDGFASVPTVGRQTGQ